MLAFPARKDGESVCGGNAPKIQVAMNRDQNHQILDRSKGSTTSPEEKQQQHVARVLTFHVVSCNVVRQLLLGLARGFPPSLRAHSACFSWVEYRRPDSPSS